MDERPISLVIADDSDDARRLALVTFARMPEFQVLGEAADLDAAAELVARHLPDVVLLDLAMPGMTGPEAIEALRRRSPETAVVMVSGYSQQDPKVQSLAALVDGYVEKGTSAPGLAAAIRAAAARRRPVPTGSAPVARPGRPPSLASLAAALHDGPVQSLSGALWTLDALGEALDEPARREELLAGLRTTLRSALEATRAITRWAQADDA
jgi:DNA-binding NarL/FixJ family response regulator